LAGEKYLVSKFGYGNAALGYLRKRVKAKSPAIAEHGKLNGE
jgi:hypothetical protein